MLGSFASASGQVEVGRLCLNARTGGGWAPLSQRQDRWRLGAFASASGQVEVGRLCLNAMTGGGWAPLSQRQDRWRLGAFASTPGQVEAGIKGDHSILPPLDVLLCCRRCSGWVSLLATPDAPSVPLGFRLLRFLFPPLSFCLLTIVDGCL